MAKDRITASADKQYKVGLQGMANDSRATRATCLVTHCSGWVIVRLNQTQTTLSPFKKSTYPKPRHTTRRHVSSVLSYIQAAATDQSYGTKEIRGNEPLKVTQLFSGWAEMSIWALTSLNWSYFLALSLWLWHRSIDAYLSFFLLCGAGHCLFPSVCVCQNVKGLSHPLLWKAPFKYSVFSIHSPGIRFSFFTSDGVRTNIQTQNTNTRTLKCDRGTPLGHKTQGLCKDLGIYKTYGDLTLSGLITYCQSPICVCF